jgi:hypothetical protein
MHAYQYRELVYTHTSTFKPPSFEIKKQTKIKSNSPQLLELASESKKKKKNIQNSTHSLSPFLRFFVSSSIQSPLVSSFPQQQETKRCIPSFFSFVRPRNKTKHNKVIDPTGIQAGRRTRTIYFWPLRNTVSRYVLS